jgi:hypothetical protein
MTTDNALLLYPVEIICSPEPIAVFAICAIEVSVEPWGSAQPLEDWKNSRMTGELRMKV